MRNRERERQRKRERRERERERERREREREREREHLLPRLLPHGERVFFSRYRCSRLWRCALGLLLRPCRSALRPLSTTWPA